MSLEVWLKYVHDKSPKITKHKRNTLQDVNLLVDMRQGTDSFKILQPYILAENWNRIFHKL